LDQFLQQLLNGLFQGSIYALIALGYTMVYGVLRFINFAHGDVFMLGAFTALGLHKLMGQTLASLPWPVSLLIVLLVSMALCAALGIIIERLAYRPLRDRPRLNVLITAIGVSLFIEYSGQLLFGATQRPFPDLIPRTAIANAGGLTISVAQVIVLVTTLALLAGLRIVVMKTRMGLAMRALSLNPTASTLMGVNNSVVISFTFGLGSALAAAGGILYASLYPSIEPFMGIQPGLKAFVAAVLGGIGNIPGAALGGLIIGVTETLVKGYGQELGIPSGYSEGVAFVLLILILVFKPSGILGRVEREKV
jgi:branched-chain amino acid transport system permease protein